MASGAVLVYVTATDARWSRSAWTLAFHVLWWPVAVETLTFLGLACPLLALAPMLLAAAATLMRSEAFRSQDYGELNFKEGLHLLIPLVQALLLRVASRSEPGDPECPRKEPQEVAIRPGGRHCELYNDHIWSKIREANGVPDDFANKGWSFDKLAGGGGKGGTLMAFIEKRYVIKELSPGDHAALLEISTSYLEHVRGGHSLLSEILLHFHDQSTKKNFFAMRHSYGDGPVQGLYDLKGCDDDKTIKANAKTLPVVRKRIWHFWMWGGTCCWSPERFTYHGGKVKARKLRLRVTRAQREQLLDAIRRDTQWLAKHNLMDYSLLIAEKRGPRGSLVSDSRHPQLLHVQDDEETSLHVSIIDFLQKWNTAKVIAQAIKVAERNKATIRPAPYAQRFAKHFESVFLPNS